MKALKVLGWIFIPYFMILFQWRKIGIIGKIGGTVWALVALVFAIGINSDPNQPGTTVATSQTTTAPVVSEQEKAADEAKKKAEEEAKAKEEAAAKAKAEEEAKKKAAEEAKKKAEMEKSKYALLAQLTIPTIAEGVELDTKTFNYIVANNNLFPAKTADAVKAARNKVDGKIKYGHLEKNITPYLDKMISATGNVVNVEESPIDGGDTVAFVHIIDNEFNSYRMLIYKSTGDILKQDRVKIIGVPIGSESFSNVSGGTTRSIFMFGSHIEKVQ